MKRIFLLWLPLLLVASCNNPATTKTEINEVQEPVSDTASASPAFFPVTDFIKGQIRDIREKGVNPLKYVTENSHTDSAWVKTTQFDSAFAEFLTPVIDISNLSGLFTEKKFLDQTLNVFTFTYDPKKSLPDSFPLMRWDVYVNPDNSKVKRVYLVKRMPRKKTLQLTWQTNEFAKMVTLAEDSNGNTVIEREITLKWAFE